MATFPSFYHFRFLFYFYICSVIRQNIQYNNTIANENLFSSSTSSTTYSVVSICCVPSLKIWSITFINSGHVFSEWSVWWTQQKWSTAISYNLLHCLPWMSSGAWWPFHYCLIYVRLTDRLLNRRNCRIYSLSQDGDPGNFSRDWLPLILSLQLSTEAAEIV